MGKVYEQVNGAIALVSNSPGIPTGYGTQGAQFLERALRHGMKCASLSNYGLEGNIGTVKVGKHQIPHYPKGFHPYSADVIPGWFQHFDNTHDRKTVLMTLYDVWVYEQMANTFRIEQKDIPIVSWVPLDHVSIPVSVASFLRRPNVTPVTMSPHGQRQLEKAGIESTYIPHAIDVHTYKRTERMKLLDMTGREYILGKNQNAYLVGMVSANKANGMVHRKSFTENFAAFALFRQTRPDAVLYVHADPSPVMGGFTLPMLAQAFGLEPGAVVFPDPVQHRLGYSDEDMAALYSALDVLLHANMGEGFGLTSLEAQACGVRVITSSWAASPDLVSEDCYLVEGQPWWNEQLKAVSQIPNVSSIARALELAYQNRGVSEKSIAFAQDFDADKVFNDKWAAILERRVCMIPLLGVPTLTRHDLCDRMLASIDYPVQDLMIIDNKPDGWEPTKPESVQRIYHIQLPQNLGVAGSWNLIIKCSPFAPSWLIVNDDVMFEPGALETMAGSLRSDALQFMDVQPKWAAFALGEDVVQKVGLFTELMHPAYFEDNDYERRASAHDVELENIPARVHHDNSSTLESGFDILNYKTFKANQETYEARATAEILTGGEWDLATRRDLSWD